jgi:hypothetical protein
LKSNLVHWLTEDVRLLDEARERRQEGVSTRVLCKSASASEQGFTTVHQEDERWL